MPLSKSILEFLEWLEENGELFDREYLVHIIGGPDGSFLREEQEADPESHAKYIKFRKMLRHTASSVTKSKWQPTTDSGALEQFLREISKEPVDDPLDQCLTEFALREVPRAVARLKKLSAMDLAKRPSQEITNYFRQAVTCYVSGLYDAVAVLSRSALEFALTETLTQRRLLPVQSNGQHEGSVKDLIDWAAKAKLLNLDCVRDAHIVRKTGNKVHGKGISEREAFTAVSLSLQVLTEIYGRRRTTGKKS